MPFLVRAGRFTFRCLFFPWKTEGHSPATASKSSYFLSHFRASVQTRGLPQKICNTWSGWRRDGHPQVLAPPISRWATGIMKPRCAPGDGCGARGPPRPPGAHANSFCWHAKGFSYKRCSLFFGVRKGILEDSGGILGILEEF